jgi:hypothetical protein
MCVQCASAEHDKSVGGSEGFVVIDCLACMAMLLTSAFSLSLSLNWNDQAGCAFVVAAARECSSARDGVRCEGVSQAAEGTSSACLLPSSQPLQPVWPPSSLQSSPCLQGSRVEVEGAFVLGDVRFGCMRCDVCDVQSHKNYSSLV